LRAFDSFYSLAVQRDKERDLDEAILAHCENGYILNTPTAFLLARAVERSASALEISDPWKKFPESSDCWFVWAASGNITEILEFIPYKKKWVAWARDDVLHFREFCIVDKIRRFKERF